MSEELFDGLIRWLHVLGAVVFIGPQIFLAAIAMPAMRSIDDARVRQATVRRITRGFGMLGGIALVVLLATGIWQYYEFESLVDPDFGRYFFLFQAKMTLVTIVIVLTALHAMVFGRKLQQLQEQNAPEAEIARVRQWSVITSMVNLAASIAIVLCATLMASNWSKL